MGLYIILFWIVGIVFWGFILYFIIKMAVVNGIKDSGILERRHDEYVEKKIAEHSPNSAQALLKERYEKGEMTFEEYKSEWNRLK